MNSLSHCRNLFFLLRLHSVVSLYHCCFLPVLERSRYFLTIHLGAWGPFLERPGKLSGPVVTGSFEKQAPGMRFQMKPIGLVGALV